MSDNITENLQCDYCGSSFSSKPLLIRHFQKHKSLKCNVCGKNYQWLNNLKYHLKYHFDENYYIVCHLCGKSVSKWRLKRHLNHHNQKDDLEISKNNQKFNCRYCGLTFSKRNNRTGHEQRIHKTKFNQGLDNFKCSDCLLVFRTSEELRGHSFEHFKGKIHYCDVPGCDRYFKKGKLLTIHKKGHFEPQYKCLNCGSVYVQRSGLSKHQKDRCPVKKVLKNQQSVEERQKVADIAKQQFIDLKGRLKKSAQVSSQKGGEKKIKKQQQLPKVVEIKQETTSEEWQYEFLDEAMLELNSLENSQVFVEDLCINEPEECSSVGKIILELENTENSTVADKNSRICVKFICDFCGKNDILNKSSLLRHLRLHKSDNSFKSSLKVSKKAPSSKQRLLPSRKRRQRLKNADNKKISRQFICDFCGKEYSNRSSIVTHLLITHKTIADFKCVQCCRKFKSQGNLLRHIKAVHLNGKDFGCEKCGAMFKQKYQLEIHIHNHDEPTNCNLCGKMVANIKVHLRHHASKASNIPVKCLMCEKMIPKYQLVRHIKSVHEKKYSYDSNKLNLKVYTCKDCGEFFNRRQELRQHEYINHSQSKIYECNVCGMYFKKQKLLNVHRFSHQPLNVACEICKKVYARKGALWKHQKIQHPELVVKNRADEMAVK